ncbi:MAG: hypothetical protein JSW55_09115, partial [Chloroflexota bacterium]
LLLGIAVLGFLGGSALGMIYSRMAAEPPTSRQPFKLRPIALVALGIVAILLVFALGAMSPFLSRLGAVLTPRSAELSATLASDAVGTHWSDPAVVGSTDGGPAQAAVDARDKHVVLVWKQDAGESSTIMYRPGRWNADVQGAEWSLPLTVDQGAGQKSQPQVALDEDGVAHIAWRAGPGVFYSRCQDNECTEPAKISEGLVAACEGTPATALDVSDQPPAVATSQDNQLMMVWHGPDGLLRYAANPAALPSDTVDSGCVLPGEASPAAQLKLAGGPENQFTLVYASDQPGGEILTISYDGGA